MSPRRLPGSSESLPSDTVPFAHASERQFARLLDFYQIEWRYEPTSFDLEVDADGNVVQRFTPDFYLPAYDLYIEITTLNQRLVTKKNRKVRRLREQ
ncbi:MAG TPA: hypoxanthine phosphoribosyltransferase, partial [Actinomycetota bacterium]